MPRIHVCPLSKLEETVRASGARSVVTLINVDTAVPTPAPIDAARHFRAGMSDIVEAVDGHVTPAEAHVEGLLRFVRRWDRAAPLVIHCYAGVSRSTAAAYLAYCALAPRVCEFEAAHLLRERSPTATPNARLVALGDALLQRDGRMIEAIRSIGRGADCFEGASFSLDVAEARA